MMRTARPISQATQHSASGDALSGKSLTAFRGALLRWYDQHRRDLPWRETRNPYRIWLSEIMLQQTRVSAVLDHYRIFLQRFPNVHALAAAPEDAVLAAWSGLGYYRRARNLHRCANEIDRQHGGQFPRSAEELLDLSGIGRYTAAAIASIAFDEPVAVVDGNVERVLERLTGARLTPPQVWQRAQGLISSSRPGDFNQAMMELGATVCIPREPRCPVCPVRKWCATQGEAPRKKALVRQQKKQIWCSLQYRDSNGSGAKVRLQQRPRKTSLMPGMWELPQSFEAPQLPADCIPWRSFRHSITITDYTIHVLRDVPLTGGKGNAGKGKWIAVESLSRIPITGLTRKILKAGGII